MSEPTNPLQNSRRRMARQRRISAQIGGQIGDLSGLQTGAQEAFSDAEREADTGDPRDMPESGAPDDAYEAGEETRVGRKRDEWEDTSTLLKIPEQKAFWGKQSPLFWGAAAVLLVALCVVVAIIFVNRWHEAELLRIEERRLQALAEEKAKYKYLYRDTIEKYAAENNIDPALIAAIIYHESRFDEKAVSNVGARGLMQIMEETGPWIAGKLGESGAYTFDSLFVADTNIRFGTWYVGYLSNRFGGDIRKIAAGYHAGQNRVADWLTNEDYSHDGWTLDVIPIPETDQYVKRVVNAYEIYKKHYYAPESAAEESRS